jgi:hypothetical protein
MPAVISSKVLINAVTGEVESKNLTCPVRRLHRQVDRDVASARNGPFDSE